MKYMYFLCRVCINQFDVCVFPLFPTEASVRSHIVWGGEASTPITWIICGTRRAYEGITGNLTRRTACMEQPWVCYRWVRLVRAATISRILSKMEKKSEKQFSFNRILKVRKLNCFHPVPGPPIFASLSATCAIAIFSFFQLRLQLPNENLWSLNEGERKWNGWKNAKYKKSINNDDTSSHSARTQRSNAHESRMVAYGLQVTSAEFLFFFNENRNGNVLSRGVVLAWERYIQRQLQHLSNYRSLIHEKSQVNAKSEGRTKLLKDEIIKCAECSRGRRMSKSFSSRTFSSFFFKLNSKQSGKEKRWAFA